MIQPFNLYKQSIVLIFLMVFSSGCALKTTVQKDPVKHIVFLWLKEPGNKEHRQKIIDATHGFKKIPGVVHVDVGEVIASERKIVDDSFDVGLTLTFEGVGAMNAYLTHPLHKDALKNILKPLVRKIVVYDYLQR